MNRVRVGVIGLGEVAQIVHLPVLESLRDEYEIAAICDVSPMLVEVMSERYGVEARHTDAAEMIATEQLDAVLVLTSDEYHSDAVIAALDSGRHVMVEKPMCLTLREAEEIIEARNRADGPQVMVGYMRRYAPAFLAAKEQLPSLGPIGYVRVHDIIGRNALIIEQTWNVHRPTDISASLMEDRRERAAKLVQEAIGSVPEDLAWTYRLLCGLGCHDLSAMRELLGKPKRVLSAHQWRNAGYLAALLEYDGYLATYETGVDDQVRFDAHIEVYGRTAQLKVQYDTPYVRHLPTTLVVERTVGAALERNVLRPHLEDPYTAELRYFHSVVTEGVVPKTTPEDFIEDLELFIEMIRVMANGGSV